MGIFSNLALALMFVQTLSAQTLSAQDPLSLIGTERTESHPIEISQIESSTEFEHKVPLTLVILDTASWTRDEVINRVRRTENIYKVCKVQFSPIILQTVSGERLASFSYTEQEDVKLLEMLRIPNRPLVFFAKKNTSVFAYDAFSWNANNSEPPRTGTAYIFESMKYVEAYYIPAKEYEVLAHELGHILLNEDHNTIPHNLMAKKASPMGDQLTPDQCAKIPRF